MPPRWSSHLWCWPAQTCRRSQDQTATRLISRSTRIFGARDVRPRRASARRAGCPVARRTRPSNRPRRPATGMDIVRYDAATGAREVLVPAESADARGRVRAPRDRRLRLVGGRPDAARLHQHAAGLARQHARRLLGARPAAAGALRKLGGTAPEASLMFAKFSPDGDARRVRARRTTSTSSASPTGRVTRLTRDGSRNDDQRHDRLGLRGGVRAARRLPLEPDGRAIAYWQFDMLRRRGVHADQHDRLAVPDAHPHSVPEGGHHATPPCASAW